MRAELLERSQLTEAEIDLLRQQAAGRGSKSFAAALGTEAKTIDWRFQRTIAKLGVTSRREAARVANVHGLI